MKLTGKCKEDFDKYIKDNVSMVYNGCPESVINAIILSFLDSIGIYIILTDEIENICGSCEEVCEDCDECHDYFEMKFSFFINVFSKMNKKSNDYKSYFYNGKNFLKSRDKAMNLAIKKANQIYNK